MPLYMDIHQHVEGLTADAAAQAHRPTCTRGEKYGVKYLHYWLDLQAGNIFCLIEAPTKDAPSPCSRGTWPPLRRVD